MEDGTIDRSFGPCPTNTVLTKVGVSTSAWTDLSIRKNKVVSITVFTDENEKRGLLIGRFHL